MSLAGVLYEVDAVLVGQTVTLRYDPAKLGRSVQVWHGGKRVELAKPLDAYANCFVKRKSSHDRLQVSAPPEPPPEGLRLRDLNKDDSHGEDR